jgi:hypothetical protein
MLATPQNFPPPEFPPTPTLSELQRIFATEFAYLILYIKSCGYECRIDDVFRDPRLHGELGEKKGYGHRNSCHKIHLAGDLSLFLEGKYLDKTSDHTRFGEWWEARSPYHAWGGRFDDGNHYSFTHNGYK